MRTFYEHEHEHDDDDGIADAIYRGSTDTADSAGAPRARRKRAAIFAAQRVVTGSTMRVSNADEMVPKTTTTAMGR